MASASAPREADPLPIDCLACGMLAVLASEDCPANTATGSHADATLRERLRRLR